MPEAGGEAVDAPLAEPVVREPGAMIRYAIVPYPARLIPQPGSFALDEETRVRVRGQLGEAEGAVLRWVEAVRRASGFPLRLEIDEREKGVDRGPPVGGLSSRPSPVRAERGTIHITLEPAVSPDPEGYKLSVTPATIRLSAGEPAGLFYGLQTLRQLLPPEVERGFREAEPTPPAGRSTPAGSSTEAGQSMAGWSVPAIEIEDAPRFPYRGMHLDVGRHFFGVSFIKKYLDLMATYKMNRFHWHLTEDQGWRLAIRRYPRLTEVGAWREETVVGKNRDPYVGDGTPHGGFYTQEEVREVVEYARARFITVIPEIEMPGHSRAALAAYPELACTPGPFQVATRWGVFEDVFCPSERTLRFLEDVLEEVVELFPGPYVHVGGDEVPKARWRESEVAQGVIAREGLGGEEELQGWFLRRIERFLQARERRLIGWDEILEGGLPEEAVVMSWRGVKGGIEAAKRGHDVIMTPTRYVYFDFYQADPANEPLAIGGHTPLERVYAFEPVPEELTAAEARHVLGAQGNVWTEYMKTPEHVEYMVLPRMLALSEVVWSPAAARNWSAFVARLPAQLRRLKAYGANYRPLSGR